MFKVKHCLVRGMDHIKANKVCQDYSGGHEDEHFSIAVISDGHGGKKYIRSDVGSKFAVETAIETVCYYMQDFERFTEAIKQNSDYVLSRMERYFLTRWNTLIEDYNDNHELTEAEKEILSKVKSKGEVNWRSFYGCTVLIAVMAEGYSYGMLVGDGTFAVVYEDGTAKITIEDPYAVANMTSSICDKQSINLFQHYFEEKQPLSMAVSSDGVCKSFGSDEHLLDYHIRLTNGMNLEQIDEVLKKNLDAFATRGSGDDCSLAVVYDAERIEENKKVLQMALAEIKKKEQERKAAEEKRKAEQLRKMEEIRLENERKAAEEERRRQEAERRRQEAERRRQEAELRRQERRRQEEERRRMMEAERRRSLDVFSFMRGGQPRPMSDDYSGGQPRPMPYGYSGDPSRPRPCGYPEDKSGYRSVEEYDQMKLQLEQEKKARELAEREMELKRQEMDLMMRKMQLEREQAGRKASQDLTPGPERLGFADTWEKVTQKVGEKTTEIVDAVESGMQKMEDKISQKLMEQAEELKYEDVTEGEVPVERISEMKETEE